MILVSLILLMALSLMSISSIELRRVGSSSATETARANARLALMQAIGQLQRTMGPDQRVSATAEILGDDLAQPHWTGVWRTAQKNGDPYISRRPEDGSLEDKRWEEGYQPEDAVMEWLVSGDETARDMPATDGVTLFRQKGEELVGVPKIPIKDRSGATSGNLAWWTGDLGVRANLRTSDPREDLAADPSTPGTGGLFRVMASQAADMKLMDGGIDLEPAKAGRLASPGMISLAGVDGAWSQDHAFDFTVESSGVLADVLHGGLKSDLTAYFENGPVSPWANLPGIKDDDPLFGAETGTEDSLADKSSAGSRYLTASPRFGMLRDWARLSLPFDGKNVDARMTDLDPSAGKDSAARALANETPVKLAGNGHAGLQPVLVEATNFTQMSTYMDQPGPPAMYQLRQLMYPRVVLWNPYNVELKMDRAIIMIQGNGRQEMITRNTNINSLPGFRSTTEWINFEGGRSTAFNGWPFIFDSAGYNDPYMGSYYFSIPATTFKPGECLVFSAARIAEYDGLSVYRPGNYDLGANELSCSVPPDPSRGYYVSASDIDGGMNFLPVDFKYAPTYSVYYNGVFGVANQSDDTRAILKHAGGARNITFEVFDKLPQIAVLSASLQYGAGKEPRIAWSKFEWMPMQLLDKAHPQPTTVPNVRTRESIRLRWFHEHLSNILGSGALKGTSYFDEALLANWNPRASFILRSPWENIGGVAPWFFGAFTRDLFDQAVSWDEQAPVPRGGRYHGNPFGPPQEGSGRYILFDVPRAETGLVSLGQFQHAKLSELVWHPSYAIGNSLADPRLGKGGNSGLNRTSPQPSSQQANARGGFHESEIGWSSDSQRSSSKGDWAATARSLLGNVPETDNLVYDLSFEANQALWDRYFLSSGTSAEKRKFLRDPDAEPLPNSRMKLAASTRATATAESLGDFHQAASQLMVDGAFNVNSTRVEAWKALLGSTRRVKFNGSSNTPFPRVLDPAEGPWDKSGFGDDDTVWAGYRELDEQEISRLAGAIVAEVKARGPFLSLADFVNRRLVEDDTGRMGALQAAIGNSGINSGLDSSYPLDNSKSLPNYTHPDNIPDATRIEQTLKPASKAWGAPAYLTQGDLLQVLGPALSARSDTFVIRAYGDATDTSGKVISRAFCEATLQRLPRPVDPDDTGLNSRLAGTPADFGRQFTVTSFRWLSPDEV